MPATLRALVVLIAALGVLTATVSAPAGAGDTDRRAVGTTVKIKPFGSWTYDESADEYRVPGVVRSRRSACERRRLVKVSGPTINLRDRTNKAGKWAVRLPGDRASGGTYTATAPRTVIRKKGRTIVCARAVDRYFLGEG